MGDLSLHFNRSEFKCKCGNCGQDTVDYELIEVLEWLRMRTCAPIVITSGNRCFEYNMAIGGSKGSQHIFSKAADIKVKGWTPLEIYDLLCQKYPEQYGIGVYDGWVHIDVRTHKARWDKT